MLSSLFATTRYNNRQIPDIANHGQLHVASHNMLVALPKETKSRQ